jgi:hypothetical protein
MSEQKKRAKSPQKRPVDKQTLKAFWDLMSQHFPGLLIDLSLFDYKAGEFNKPKVSKEDYAKEKEVPVEKAYDTVLKLLPKYHKGKDILWKPSDYYKEHRDALVSLVWLDDFKLDNPLKLIPFLYVQTSLGKYQAIFKLSEPATVDDTDTVQKTMAKILKLGDNAATSFFHHRRMPGLANGKYEDDPLVIFTVPETPSRISIRDIETALRKEEEGVSENNAVVNGQETEGQGQPEGQGTKGQEQDKGQSRTKDFYVRPVVPANYPPVKYKPREDFIKRKEDETIDESATDIAWATHYARKMTNFGWDDAAIAFTVFDLLARKSPELKRRKKTNDHALDYLYRTVWKAIDYVKKTPSENRGRDNRDKDNIADLLDSF